MTVTVLLLYQEYLPKLETFVNEKKVQLIWSNTWTIHLYKYFDEAYFQLISIS